MSPKPPPDRSSPGDATSDRRRHDPRMVGFERRAPVAEVLALLRSRRGEPLPAETVGLRHLAGRVLASDVRSTVDVPGFDRAAMDGFAVIATDTSGATGDQPCSLEVLGTSLPAHPFAGALRSGSAVRIMTGAPLPAGADAVVPAENTHAADPEGREVQVLAEIESGKHVGRRGEDIQSGSTLLSGGRRLRPQDLGCLSSIGISEARVVRRPSVDVWMTGNELLEAGTRPEGFRITDANSPLLLACCERDGAVANEPRRLVDDRRAITDVLRESEADVVLITGGSSVGQEDHVPSVVAELGELAVHGIAMRPGKPAGVGFIDGRIVFLIPGNPVACLATFDVIIGPTIRRLGGRSEAWPYPISRLPLTRDVSSALDRVDYVRAAITPEGVEPLGASGASILSSTTRADGVFLIAAETEKLTRGSLVDVYRYDSPTP